jgi:uncharacterized membrane protein
MSASVTGWPRLVLIASLALNLFAAGALATALATDRGWLPGLRSHARPGRLIGLPNPRQLRAALPESGQRALDDALRAHGAEIRRRIHDLAAARLEVAAAIRAEPFERAGLDAALARLREREAAVAVATQAMMAELVERLDAEGRARVADLLPPRRPGPRHPGEP